MSIKEQFLSKPNLYNVSHTKTYNYSKKCFNLTLHCKKVILWNLTVYFTEFSHIFPINCLYEQRKLLILKCIRMRFINSYEVLFILFIVLFAL